MLSAFTTVAFLAAAPIVAYVMDWCGLAIRPAMCASSEKPSGSSPAMRRSNSAFAALAFSRSRHASWSAPLRRPAARQEVTSLSCGDLTMELLTRRVTRAGRRLDLLPREFKLLEHLLRHKDRVVTRTMMLEELWDYRFDPHTSLIDTHISRLRKKIDDDFDSPLLHTVRGSGYRLSERP